MAFMKFYTGSEANAQSYLDGIYLATDTHKLFYKGSPYGGDPYVELDWIQDFKSGSGTMEEAAFNKLKDAVDNYKLLVVSCSGSAHSTRVCTPEIGDDGSYICKFTDINNYENAEEYILAVKIASVNPSTRAITMLHDTTYHLGGKDIDLSNYYTIAQVDGKIGTNTYTGANYISKETNLTDAVLQLDTEIKATNDNLALEHTNAEATYAKKTELGNYLTRTDASNTYQLKGSYLTSVSIATISDLNSGWDALLKAAPNIPSLNGYATQEWVNGKGFLTKATADGYYQPKGNYLTSVSWSQVSGKPTFATVATSGSYNDLTNKPTIPNVSTFNHGGTIISLIIDSNTLTFKSDGIAFNGSSIMAVPVVEVLSTEEINQILNS